MRIAKPLKPDLTVVMGHTKFLALLNALPSNPKVFEPYNERTIVVEEKKTEEEDFFMLVIPPHIVELPPNVTFRNSIYIENGNLTTFNHKVKGTAIFRNLPHLKTFGPKASFGTDLIVEHTALESFNNNAGDNADFDHNPHLRHFGLGCKFYGLSISESPLTCFDCVVDGDLDITDTPTLQSFGPHARFNGDVSFSNTSIAEFNHFCGGSVCILDSNGQFLKRIGSSAHVEGDFSVMRAGKLMEFDGYIGGDAEFSQMPQLGPKAKIMGNVSIKPDYYSSMDLD